MKSLGKSLALVCAFAIPAVLAIGCGDDSGSTSDGPLMVDLSAMKDMTMKPCTTGGTWPSDNVFVQGNAAVMSDPYYWVTEGDALKTTGANTDDLSVELWYQPSTPTPPQTVTLDASTTYLDCDYCVLVYQNVDQNTGNYDTSYLARSGTLTVTKGDVTPSGQMQVTGMNIHLVEWDLMQDSAVKNGGCYDVSSFSISGSYTAPDGGTDM